MKEIDRTLLAKVSRLQAPDCPSIRALGDFLDGKIDTEQKQSLEAHLRACPACINLLIELRELARLTNEGDEPPQTLVNDLKRLVSPTTMAEQGQNPGPNRLAQIFSKIWETVWKWTSPRFIGEVVAASAVAVFILFLGPTLWQQQPSGFRGGEQIKTLAELTAPEQKVLTALSLAPARPDPLQQQLVSTLEKLPKNLLLEQTRGATNVEVYKKAALATVLVVTDQSLGSGAVISSQGEVLTNWHVLQGANRAAVVFKPQRGVEVKKELAFAVTLLKVDQVADLALLKIHTPPKNLSVLPLGDITEVEVGQDVHAIGHPEGEVWTYTTGIISQVRPGYQWTGADGLLHQSKVIQTQTALNPGNSGGPLLNDQAEIIGVNSFRGEGEGLNYAVAVDVVKEFLQRAGEGAATPGPGQRASSYRMEPYGTNIVGVYVNARVPPPDAWFVYDHAQERLAYVAKGNRSATQIDTILREDPTSQLLTFYFDLDCDGKVDLIGFDSDGNGTPDRYDLPQGSIKMIDLATDLVQAFRQGVIPYSQVRMCQ